MLVLRLKKVIRLGLVVQQGSIYRLHWIPLSRAYDSENPFVSPLDASTAIEQEEESRMIEAENLEVAQYQSSGDDGDFHLDVRSEGTGSLVPSEDEDTYATTREMSLPLASPSVLTLARDSVKMQKLQFDEDLQTSTKWGLDVVEASEDKPSSSCKWCPVHSTLAEEIFSDAKTSEEPPCDYNGSEENKTPQTHAVRDNVLSVSEMDGSSTCNIWSRRGKAASVLQLRTNKSEGKQKQIGNQPKDKLHRKQALSGKSISLTQRISPQVLIC